MAITYNVYRDGVQIASELTDTAFTDTELTPNTTYEYQVSATNEFGESELSAPIEVTTDGEVPEAPAGLNASNVTETTVDLAWNE